MNHSTSSVQRCSQARHARPAQDGGGRVPAWGWEEAEAALGRSSLVTPVSGTIPFRNVLLLTCIPLVACR